MGRSYQTIKAKYEAALKALKEEEAACSEARRQSAIDMERFYMIQDRLRVEREACKALRDQLSAEKKAHAKTKRSRSAFRARLREANEHRDIMAASIQAYRKQTKVDCERMAAYIAAVEYAPTVELCSWGREEIVAPQTHALGAIYERTIAAQALGFSVRLVVHSNPEPTMTLEYYTRDAIGRARCALPVATEQLARDLRPIGPPPVTGRAIVK